MTTKKPIANYSGKFDELHSTDNLPINTLLQEPTGFDNPGGVIINYDPTAQTITLTGTFNAYWRGILNTTIATGWTSLAHTNTTGHIYWLYYDGSNIQWSTDTFPGMNNLLIAFVNYGATDKYAVRECHGFMPWQSHQEDHETIGTYRQSGGALSNYTLASTTATDRRPDVAATYVKDEDLITINPSLTSKLYTKLFLTSTGLDNYTVETAEIVSVTGSRPNWNQFTGGAWTQTQMSTTSYMSVWLIAVPTTASITSQKYRYLWLQGQANSNTLVAEQSLVPANLNLGTLQNESPEFIFIAKIIIHYTGGDWNIAEVDILTGNKFSQIGSPAGVGLTSVSTDATLSGNGTVGSPLSVVSSPKLTTARNINSVPFDGTADITISAAASPTNPDILNQTITQDTTISDNAISMGIVTIASGITVTVASGKTWTISDTQGNTVYGNRAPNFTPAFVNQIYQDKLNNQLYFATGTDSASNWLLSSDNPLGQYTQLGFQGLGSAQIDAVRIYVPYTKVLKGVIFHNGANNTCKLQWAIYSDSSTAPANLLAQTNELTITSASDYDQITMNFINPLLITGGSYIWVAALKGTANFSIPCWNTTTNRSVYLSRTYTLGFPNPFGTPTGNNYMMSFQVL